MIPFSFKFNHFLDLHNVKKHKKKTALQMQEAAFKQTKPIFKSVNQED